MNVRAFVSPGVFRLVSAAVSALLLASCVDPKEVLYIQDITDEAHQNIVTRYQTTIQKDDQLYISVSSKQPELTAPFIMAEMGNSISNNNNTSRPKGYLVDDEGYIVLPVIGRMKAARKTCTQLASDISAKLRGSDYIKDASVNVQIMNFKFSILGEVNNPGSYQVDGQRVTIFDAISRAGDLNIDGNRDIVLIRETEHARKVVKLDLRSKSIFSSPYYYIRQNDIIYVTPSDRKVNMRSESAQYYAWGLSGLSLIIAVIAISL